MHVQYHMHNTLSASLTHSDKNSAMSTHSSHSFHQGHGGGQCSQPAELVVTNFTTNTLSPRGSQQGGG